MVYKQQNASWRVKSGDKTMLFVLQVTLAVVEDWERGYASNRQNIEAWMVKPLSAGCVNTVVAC